MIKKNIYKYDDIKFKEKPNFKEGVLFSSCSLSSPKMSNSTLCG
jgi:hypothetical protein